MAVPVNPTAFAVTTLPSPNLGAGINIVYGAIDAANGNKVPNTGHEIVLIKNPTGGALTVTFYSSADSLGRLGDITAESVPATPGEHAFGPFPTNGWSQADGSLVFQCTAALTACVLKVP